MAHISGFPEFLPGTQQCFETWKAQVIHLFSSWGFYPLETSAVERLTTLTSKGDDHEIYALHRLNEENLESTLGLRFDLTVPMARYVMEHEGRLTFPYRRFHVAPVWRGERAQEGRYRQFYQCDIDVVGKETLSFLYDAEVLAVMHQAIERLDIEEKLGPVRWSINHRGILISWLNHSGIAQEQQGEALRWIDKRGKVTFEDILKNLKALGGRQEGLDLLKSWADFTGQVQQQTQDGTLDKEVCPFSLVVDYIKAGVLGQDPLCAAGLDQLSCIFSRLKTFSPSFTRGFFDPLLARGLGYYSGIVYEASLIQHPHWGSISAGGRYDHLAQHMMHKNSLPGVGASLGLSRLFGFWQNKQEHPLQAGDVLIGVQDFEALDFYIHLAKELRAHGLNVETYLQPHPLRKQISYAHQKGYTWVVLANDQERQQKKLQIKHLPSSQQKEVSWVALKQCLDALDHPAPLKSAQGFQKIIENL